MTEVEQLREMAEVFRNIAEAADKLASILEDGNATEEEIDNAAKDYLWQAVKLAELQN